MPEKKKNFPCPTFNSTETRCAKESYFFYLWRTYRVFAAVREFFPERTFLADFHPPRFYVSLISYPLFSYFALLQESDFPFAEEGTPLTGRSPSRRIRSFTNRGPAKSYRPLPFNWRCVSGSLRVSHRDSPDLIEQFYYGAATPDMRRVHKSTPVYLRLSTGCCVTISIKRDSYVIIDSSNKSERH